MKKTFAVLALLCGGVASAQPLPSLNNPALHLGQYKPYYMTATAFLGLGQVTNALGVVTNNVAVSSSSVYSPTNTAFDCADYGNVGFQLTGTVVNGAGGASCAVLIELSDDGTNYDNTNPVLVSAPLTTSGQLVLRTNITIPSSRWIALMSLTDASATAYLTNQAVVWSGKATREHVGP